MLWETVKSFSFAAQAGVRELGVPLLCLPLQGKPRTLSLLAGRHWFLCKCKRTHADRHPGENSDWHFRKSSGPICLISLTERKETFSKLLNKVHLVYWIKLEFTVPAFLTDNSTEQTNHQNLWNRTNFHSCRSDSQRLNAAEMSL